MNQGDTVSKLDLRQSGKAQYWTFLIFVAFCKDFIYWTERARENMSREEEQKEKQTPH